MFRSEPDKMSLKQTNTSETADQKIIVSFYTEKSIVFWSSVSG